MLQEWDDARGIGVKTTCRKMPLSKVTAGGKVFGMLLHPALVDGKGVCKLERRFSQPETHSQWTGSGVLEDHWEMAQPRNR